MKAVFIKEIKQYLNNLTIVIATCIFLLVNGLFLFVFTETSLLDYGFASLEFFFETTPFVLIFLIAAITMRSFSEELKSGTFEILATKPISKTAIILGKFFASLVLVFISLLPTLFYAYTLSDLSVSNVGLDIGATLGAYLGLLFLSAVFICVGLFCSSITTNSIVAFLLSCLFSYILYDGFEKLSQLNIFKNSFLIESMGLSYHFRSISKGVIDSKDIIYFLSFIIAFIFFTNRKITLK